MRPSPPHKDSVKLRVFEYPRVSLTYCRHAAKRAPAEGHCFQSPGRFRILLRA